jgi:hypothetical protein
MCVSKRIGTDMPRKPIDSFRDGDSFDDVYLANDKQLRTNKNGNTYVQLELRDRSGGISARSKGKSKTSRARSRPSSPTSNASKPRR